jgi:hypothetical protein
MRLHSTLEGRAGAFRLRGAAWEINPLTFRGFLYLIPIRDAGDGRYHVVDAAGGSVWKLLEALGEQVTSTAGARVDRLDARAVGPKTRSATATRRDGVREAIA